MAARAGTVLQQLVRSVAGAESAAVTDRELLGRFAEASDEAAFALLVARHSGMVFGVCRRRLPTVQDAEDACQAVFLILARKAKAVRWDRSVANWLYTTARQVAAQSRRDSERRARREGKAAAPEPASLVDAITGRELLEILDDELGKLPPKYREPLVLCYLEGLSRKDVAARLGVPEGTVKTRLERGRKRLETALSRRGVGLGAGLLTLAVTSPAGASPLRLFDSILAAVSGSPSGAAAALAKGVVMNRLFSPTKLALLVLAGVAALGLGAYAFRADQAAPRAAESPPAAKPAGEDETNFRGTWALTAIDFENKKVPQDQVKGRVFTFADGRHAEKGRDGKLYYPSTYKLNPTRTPKEIDLVPEGDQPGDVKLIRAIYAFDGDRLKLSWFLKDRDKKRPTSFAGAAGSGQFVWHFRAMKLGPPVEPAEEPEFVKDRPTKEADGDDAERRLVKKRYNLRLASLRLKYMDLLAGRGSVEALNAASRKLLDSALELAIPAEASVAAHERHLAFAKVIEEIGRIYAVPPEGDIPRLTMADYQLAQEARLDAEIDLLRARRQLKR